MEAVNDEFNGENQLRLKWYTPILFFLFYFGSAAVLGLIIVILSFFIQVNYLVDILSVGYYALLVDAVIFFIVLMAYKSIRKFITPIIDFSVLRYKKTYGYIILGFILFFVFQYVLIDLLHVNDPSQQPSDLGLDKMGGISQYALALVSIALITPIKEEILFRGIIYRFFEKYKRFGIWLGLIISSVSFGMLHFDLEITATIMGVILVILYKLTNSLVPSIILHILWNLLGVIAFLFS